MKVLVLSTLAALAMALPASAAFTFNITYDPSFAASFGANTAAAQAAIANVVAGYQSDFTDNIHVNITVAGVADQSILGESNTSINQFTYAQLFNAELADGTSADDATATGLGGSLGGNGTVGSGADPTGGGAFWATTAQQKALGLTADDASTSDGKTIFGAGFSYTFSGAIAPGTIDFQGVVEHEFSEVMGRIGLSGGSVVTKAGTVPNSYTLLDAYALTGPNAHAPTFAANDFFSIDNGNTLLLQFNQSGGGDSRDWQGATNDSFNAFSSSGVANPVSATDIRVMDVLGYDVSAQALTPEPGSILLLGSGLGLGIAAYRRRRA